MYNNYIVMMRRKKLASSSRIHNLMNCVPSLIITLNILSCCSCQVIKSVNSLPSTLNRNNNFDLRGTESVILNTKNVDRDNGGVTDGYSININNSRSNVVQNMSVGERPTEREYSIKNVDKVTRNDMSVTDSPVKEKESVESENLQGERDVSRNMTFATELYKDNTVDRVVAVNQSNVSASVTKFKTELETSPNTNSIDSREEEESSTLLVLRLAQCRANCLAKKSEKLKKRQKYSAYFKKLDVFASTLKEQIKLSYNECWNTCLLLEIENGENHPGELVDVTCSLNNNTCLSGCQEACEFHNVQHVAKNGTKAPLLAAKVEPFLSYNLSTPSMRKRGGFQLDLRWPESDGFLVYSVVQHVRLFKKNIRLGWTWRLLEQTTNWKISLSFTEKPKIGDIRVLAANPYNLVHVFSQEKLKATHIPREQVNLVKSQKSHYNHHHQQEDPQDSWHLRKVSMVHQKFLVVTEITWDLPQNKSQAPSPSSSQSSHMNSNSITKQGNDTQMKEASDIQQTVSSSSSSQNQIKCNFLLTWEVSGGILRGNMVTDSNTVTISLWPDTIYSIQVGLIDEESDEKGDKKPLKPWEVEGEPKVTIKSSFLSVNTSDAVYLQPAVEKSESDIKSELRGVQSVTLEGDEEHESQQHQTRESESVELISSFAHIQHYGGGGEGDNDHIRNSTTTSITRWKCELTSGVSKWFCQLSISWLVILSTVYALLFILSIIIYLFFAFKNYPYSTRQLSNFFKRSTCKLVLLQDDFQQQRHDDDSQLPHFQNDPTRKEMDTLSQYNIV